MSYRIFYFITQFLMAITLMTFTSLEQVHGQEKKDEFNISTAFLSPYGPGLSFERVGFINSYSIGWTSRFPEGNFVASYGMNFGASFFFPNGGVLSAPQITPSARITFALAKRISAKVTFGAVNAPSFGGKFDVSYSLTSSNNSPVLDFTTLVQSFDIGNAKTSKQISVLALLKLSHKVAIGKKLNVFANGALGIRYDGFGLVEPTVNGTIGASRGAVTLVVSYTNDVPVPGLPAYFIPVLKVNLLTLIRK